MFNEIPYLMRSNCFPFVIIIFVFVSEIIVITFQVCEHFCLAYINFFMIFFLRTQQQKCMLHNEPEPDYPQNANGLQTIIWHQIKQNKIKCTEYTWVEYENADRKNCTTPNTVELHLLDKTIDETSNRFEVKWEHFW